MKNIVYSFIQQAQSAVKRMMTANACLCTGILGTGCLNLSHGTHRFIYE